MNRKFVTIFIFVLIIIGGIYVYFNGITYFEKQMEKDVRAHLINNGYTNDEIKEIKGIYEIKDVGSSLSGYQAIVRFKDEPNSFYIYVKHKKRNTIQQDTYSSRNPKHLEE